MAKVKTSELQDKALSYVVSMLEHPELIWGQTIGVHEHSDQIIVPSFKEPHCYSPYKSWAMCGPIIEREELEIEPVRKDKVNGIGNVTGWRAIHPKNYGGLNRFYGYGETPLIAAMRCHVASKLGDFVEIPDELI